MNNYEEKGSPKEYDKEPKKEEKCVIVNVHVKCDDKKDCDKNCVTVNVYAKCGKDCCFNKEDRCGDLVEVNVFADCDKPHKG